MLHELSVFLEENRVEDTVSYAVQLSVEELLLNIMKHGYRGDTQRLITMSLDVEPAEAVIHIEDDGDPFDPSTAPGPDFDEILHGQKVGGLGIHLVRSLAASFDYARVGNRNQVRVRILPLSGSKS